ncbi:MAG: CYTH domain-containing protein [Flavobacteriales bacterium]
MLEIERKYLLQSIEWEKETILSKSEIKQAYLFEDREKSVRIRVKNQGAFLTIKMGAGMTRYEFEYEIPKEDALQLIEVAKLKCLSKTRYEVQFSGETWEIDVFHGKYEGLILAEIELEAEDHEFNLPPWIGSEVTGDPAYLNVELFKNL